MWSDNDLGFFTNWLGIGIMVLLVLYHYVTADAQPQQQ